MSRDVWSSGGSFALPNIIEDDRWTGARATILPGVTLGKGSTVAAGRVIVRDGDGYSIADGVPTEVIRKMSKSEKYDLVRRRV